MNNTSFDWAIIGAGPAGIAAVGKLIDHGINPQKIAWVDPEFTVGDFGTKWRNVLSNTRVELFTKFLNESSAFNYSSTPKKFEIEILAANETCLLSIMAEPLQWVSSHLKETVHTFHSRAQKLKLQNRLWEISLIEEKIHAKNVILATGAEPHSLSFPTEEIPLAIALDPEKLISVCNKDDVIAVFGSSHSAMIILKTLLEQSEVKKVINFYLSPLTFAVYFDDWILFDNTGLKGDTAEWAKKNINGKQPINLERIISNEENISVNLPLCTKVIYAMGFQKRILPIDGISLLKYNQHTGIIAPGLFGLGIAFPEATTDRYGQTSSQVGLWKFIDYLNRVMPVWLNYGT